MNQRQTQCEGQELEYIFSTYYVFAAMMIFFIETEDLYAICSTDFEPLWEPFFVGLFKYTWLAMNVSLSDCCIYSLVSLKKSPDYMKGLWITQSNPSRGFKTWTYGNSSAGRQLLYCCEWTAQCPTHSFVIAEDSAVMVICDLGHFNFAFAVHKR